jgi:hypothetical protein
VWVGKDQTAGKSLPGEKSSSCVHLYACVSIGTCASAHVCVFGEGDECVKQCVCMCVSTCLCVAGMRQHACVRVSCACLPVHVSE